MSYEYMSVRFENMRNGRVHVVDFTSDHEPEEWYQEAPEWLAGRLDYTDHAGVREVCQRFSMAGFGVTSLVVHLTSAQADFTSQAPTPENIAALHEALKDGDAERICAYAFAVSLDNVDSWEDALCIHQETAQDVIREWLDIYQPRYEEQSGKYAFSDPVYVKTDPIPDFLDIDWRASLEALARDNYCTVVGFAGELWLFGN